MENSKYQCSLVGTPFGIKKHIFGWLWLTPVHIFGIHGFYMVWMGIVPRSLDLAILLTVLGYIAGTGITMGCHRYWSHRTFKAKLPLQIILMWMQTMSGQLSIFKWCRDHRIHHKYTETEADPYDASRGFWFSHVGWLLTPEHPTVLKNEDKLDFTDLDKDPVVRFQSKYYWYLLPLSAFLVPISIISYLFPELDSYQLLCTNYTWQVYCFHFTWLVNSAAHMWGYRPYDKGIYATENPLISLLAVGEGWHNYHHTFPWDYKSAELGFYFLNLTTLFIDICGRLGLAYDLKSVSEEVVMERVKRTGDPEVHKSHKSWVDTDTLPPWGWGDKDIPENHFRVTQTL